MMRKRRRGCIRGGGSQHPVATAAIAGLPPLAGFFSKDEILWFAFASNRGGATLLFVVAAATALLTSFYMFRLLWLTFFGRSRMVPDVEHHVHESPLAMTAILVVLAVLSAIGGFIPVPHYLEAMLPLPEVVEGRGPMQTPLMFVSVALALVGLLAAAWLYGGASARSERIARAFPLVHRLLYGKYYVDEAYDRVLERPLFWISDRVFLRVGDHALLDGSLHGLAALGRRTAGALVRIQTGNLHWYAWLALAGIVMSLVWSASHG